MTTLQCIRRRRGPSPLALFLSSQPRSRYRSTTNFPTQPPTSMSRIPSIPCLISPGRRLFLFIRDPPDIGPCRLNLSTDLKSKPQQPPHYSGYSSDSRIGSQLHLRAFPCIHSSIHPFTHLSTRGAEKQDRTSPERGKSHDAQPITHFITRKPTLRRSHSSEKPHLLANDLMCCDSFFLAPVSYWFANPPKKKTGFLSGWTTHAFRRNPSLLWVPNGLAGTAGKEEGGSSRQREWPEV